MEGNQFHVKVRDAYLELANSDTTGRWRVIDASQSLEEVEDALWAEVSRVLKL